jgi:hypothetical protein
MGTVAQEPPHGAPDPVGLGADGFLAVDHAGLPAPDIEALGGRHVHPSPVEGGSPLTVRVRTWSDVRLERAIRST